MKHLSVVVLAVGTIMLAPVRLNAQVQNVGSITGSVENNTGGVILGAKVVATEIATGVATAAQTTSGSVYFINQVADGTCAVTATRQGF